MYSFNIKPKYSIGLLAACGVSKRIGEISKVWVKTIKLDDFNYNYLVSYTVRPTSGNQFKVSEDEIRMIASDEDGNEIILPKGME